MPMTSSNFQSNPPSLAEIVPNTTAGTKVNRPEHFSAQNQELRLAIIRSPSRVRCARTAVISGNCAAMSRA